MDPLTGFLAKRRYITALLIALLALGILGIRASAVPSDQITSGRIPAPRQGFLAPAFELESLEGESLSLESYQGQIVLVNLWTSWCPPCRAEMPALQALYEQYSDQGLVILAVNMTFQDSADAAQSFAREFDLTFPVLLDRTGQVGSLYHLRALPSTFFIDRQGVIQEVVVGGPLSEVTLRSMVTDLLAVEP